ncbi:MAG: hypothetical protein MJZ30_02050 [Paludibacteraceae bacterium]|nr:hypothetical protein [Paludibacteraceae bacterium]
MCVDKNIRRGVFTVAVSLLWGIVSATPFSQANHSLVKDPEIEAADFQHIDEKKIIDQYLKLPEISSPMGFTPDMMNKVSLANPAEKVGLIQPPYPNNQGDLRLTYPLEFTPARIQPSVGISYSSRFETRNMGEGWNFDVLHISLDTIRYKNPQEAQELVTCLVDGVRYVSAVEACEGDSLFYYAETQPTSSYLVRYEKELKHYYWKLVKQDGSVSFFDWRGKSDKDDENDIVLCDGAQCKDNGSRLTDMDRSLAGEWYVTRQEDHYGNYVSYVYKNVANRPYLDSIFVGNKGYDHYHTYYTFGYGLYQYTDEVESYGFKSVYTQRLSSMEVYFIKDEVKVQEIEHSTSQNQPSLYDRLRSYSFEYYPLSQYDILKNAKEPEDQGKTLLASISQDGIGKHRFDYFYDTKLIEDRQNYRKYMEQDPNAKDVTPYLVDRTNKLHTVHIPLGGCFSVDYDWMYYQLPDPTIDDESFVKEVTMKEAESLAKENVKHLLVLSYLRINDGVLDKSYNTNHTFAYEGGVWDDQATWFHGFKKVINQNHDANLGDDPYHDEMLYRTWIKEYGTGKFETESKITGVTLLDKEGKEKKSIKISYTTGSVYGSNVLFKNKVNHTDTKNQKLYLPRVSSQVVSWEGGLVEKIFAYNNSGNLFDNNRCIYFTERPKGTNGKTVELVYDNITSNIMTRELPMTLKLWNGGIGSERYGAINLTYEDKHSPEKITSVEESYFNQKLSRKISYQYDKDGNMTHIIYPKDANNEQKKVDFLYDRRFNMYLNRIDNSLGYRTELEDYDYRYGVARTIFDRNGVRMKREIDDMGRVRKIIAPNEIETNSPYSVKFEYVKLNKLEDIPDYVYFEDLLHAELYLNKTVESFREDVLNNNFASVLDAVSQATGVDAEKICTADWTYPEEAMVDEVDADARRCFCVDQAQPNYALTTFNQSTGHNTYTFVDGFGRIIQSKDQRLVTMDQSGGGAGKHDFIESEMYLVSGRTVYDGFGREILKNSYLLEEKGDEKVYTAKASKTIALEQTFDELDRIRMVDDDKANKVYKYQMSEDGELTMNETVTEQSGKRYGVENRYDIRGNLVYNLCEDPAKLCFREITYRYDALNHINSIFGHGTSVSYTYDDLGRAITRTENGMTTKFEYDNADNLLSESRPDGTQVSYGYKLGQLKTIQYKKGDLSELVKLDYGKNNAKHNRVGLLCYVQDATGVQEMYYNKMGGISKIRKSIVAPNKEIETYEMKWDYDSWNHLTQVVYPDQEKVSYSYNLNGLVTSITGDKSYTYKYAQSMGYDELGNLIHVQYNNGDDNYFSYLENTCDMISASVFSDKKNEDIFGTRSMDESSSVYFVNDVLVSKMVNSVDLWGRVWDASGEYTELGNSKTSYNVSYSYGGWNKNSADESYVHESNGVKVSLHKQLKYNYVNAGCPYLASVEEEITRDGVTEKATKTIQYNPNNDMSDQGSNRYVYDYNKKLLGVVDNGYVSVYFNDAFGENVVAINGGGENVFVNSEWQQGNTSIAEQFPLRLNAFFEMDADSNYYKHILWDDKVIVSKLGNAKSYGENARREVRAGADYDGVKPDYKVLYDHAYEKLASTYALLGVPFQVEKVDYKEPQDVVLRSSNIGTGNDECEPTQYYYHWLSGDRLVYLSDIEGEVTELVMENPERLSISVQRPSWSTPYRSKDGFYDMIHHYLVRDNVYDLNLGVQLNGVVNLEK